MRNLKLSVLFLVILFGGQLFAQNSLKELIIKDSLSIDYPFLYKVILSADVSYSPSTGFYYYKYTLTNDSKNKGNIWIFEIDITRQPGSVIYDTVGLKFAGNFEESQFRRYYPKAATLVESIGFPSLPNYHWDAVIAHNSAASFAADTLLPKPGTNVSGFTMMSKAPPGIRSFTAIADFNVYKYYPDIDKDTTAELDSVYNLINAYVDSMKNAVNYNGWTIGPTAPLLNSSSTSLIDTLISYKHRCGALGWIDNQGIVNSLDSKLDNAKKKLAAGDSTAAVNILNAFVNEVEAQKGKHLTSEAYALLKYNAEYLIKRLK